MCHTVGFNEGKSLQSLLRILIFPYFPGKNVVTYNLSKLTRLLAFEDERQCAQFCQSCGISAEEDSDTVYMEKSCFFYPETSTTTQRFVEN